MSYAYSMDFKIRAVKDTLNRQRGVSLTDKAKEFGISRTTLSKWLKLYRSRRLRAAHIADDSSGSNTDNSEQAHVNPRTRKVRPKRTSLGHRDCMKDLEEIKKDHNLLVEQITSLKAELIIKDRLISDLLAAPPVIEKL